MDSDHSQNEQQRGYVSDCCQTNRLENLPQELSLDLISRLPISSLMRFRFVSKSCQTLSFDPHLLNLHRSRTSLAINTCLIFHFHYPFGNQLSFVEFSDHNDKEIIVRKMQLPFPNPMLALNVIGSCNGLICSSYSKNHDVIHVFNPFTRSYKQLPESMQQFEIQKVVAGFGFHPLTNEYKVVRIVYYQDINNRPRNGGGYSESQVQVCSLGSSSSEWRCIGKMPYQVDYDWSAKPLLLNGRLHLLARGDYNDQGDIEKIISFDLEDEQFREVPTPNWDGIWKHPYPLAVLGGCLSVVIYNPHVRTTLEIWVMKEYGAVESWSKHAEIDVNDMKSIGDVHDHDSWVPKKVRHSFGSRVLCQTSSGGILLMHAGGGGGLASYDPESRELKNVKFEGMPFGFQAIVHEGSLVNLD